MRMAHRIWCAMLRLAILFIEYLDYLLQNPLTVLTVLINGIEATWVMGKVVDL